MRSIQRETPNRPGLLHSFLWLALKIDESFEALNQQDCQLNLFLHWPVKAVYVQSSASEILSFFCLIFLMLGGIF